MLSWPYKGYFGLLSQLLCGVAYMHHKDVVHADIKPGNVVVDDAQVWRIIDVGLSWVDRPGLRLTAGSDAELGGLRLMTPCYRSPEVYLCDPNFGKPMDMWGVGCIALELVAGTPLIQFHQQTPLDIVKKIFLQCSVSDHQAVVYFRRLPAWTGSMGKVPFLPTQALEPRLDARGLPALVIEFICHGLLVVHPLHRIKVGPARHRLSGMTT